MRIPQSLGVLMLLAAIAISSSFRSGSAQTATVLKPGDLAPEFSLPGTDDRTYKLADFRGKKAVVLAWFVKAFTAA